MAVAKPWIDDAFGWWVENIMPSVQERFSTVAAKGRWFIDENGNRVDSNKPDQPMSMHVFNAVAFVHRVIEEMDLVDRLITKDEELLTYLAITVHDVHKLVKEPETGATWGHLAPVKPYVDLARELGYTETIAPLDAFNRIKTSIDFHHEWKNFNTENIHGKHGRYWKDPIFYLLILGDGVSSTDSVIEANDIVEKVLSRMVINIQSFNDDFRFNYHCTARRGDDLSMAIHDSMERYLIEKGWKPVAYFTNGTLYYLNGEIEIDDEEVAEIIAGDLDDLLSEDVIKFKIQSNFSRPATKNYEKNFKLSRTWKLFGMNLLEKPLEKKFSKKKMDKYLIDGEKGKAWQSDHPDEWIQKYKKIGYDTYHHVAYSIISCVYDLVKDYELVENFDKLDDTVKDEEMIKLILGEVKNEIKEEMEFFDIRDAKGTRAGNSMKYYLIPLAGFMHDKVYQQGQDARQFAIDALSWIERRMKECYGKESFSKRMGSTPTVSDRLVGLISNEVVVGKTIKPVSSPTFGLKEYASALDGFPREFNTRCYLCGDTRTYTPPSPGLVKAGLKIQSDRVPSGKGIDATGIKRICFRCWANLKLRNQKYERINKGDHAYYFMIEPSYTFTRDHERWIGKQISMLYRLSAKNIRELKKVIGDRSRSADLVEDTMMIDGAGIKMISSNYGFLSGRNGSTKVASLLARSTLKMNEKNVKDLIGKKSREELDDDDAEWVALLAELEAGAIIQKHYHNNGFISVMNFYDGKDENETSEWMLAGTAAMIIAVVTGCRVTVSTEYGNLPIIKSNAMVTLDAPAPLFKKIIGKDIELAGNDLERKIDIATRIVYVNNQISDKSNTIPSVIKTLVETPERAVDYCYKCKEGSFYSVFNAVDSILRSMEIR